MKVTVVVPAYNEEGNVTELVRRIRNAITGYEIEITFVDDGSTDGTLSEIKRTSEQYENIHFLSLSRNFGHQNAIKAGLDFARGDCVITIDGDLQHPPELIPEMLCRWREGFEIVSAVRVSDQCISPFKRITARLFYRLANRISEIKMTEGGADFRLLDASVVRVLARINESSPFYRGLVPWVGFRQCTVCYDASNRYSGKTKYTLKRMIQFALGGIVSFSILPLRLAIFLGFFMAVSAFAVGFKAIYDVFVTHQVVPGWASTIVSVVLVGGVQLIILGIIGEYLGRLFIESKGRPNYIIRESSIDAEKKT